MAARTTKHRSVIDQWLETCFLEQPGALSAASPQPQLFTPPTSTSSARRKRPRDMSEPRPRSSQKRQRTRREDDVFSEQSASDVAITELSEKTRLSQPSFSGRSGPKRATSPVRDLMNDLRVSKPAILCEIPSTVSLPQHASTLQRGLMERLDEAIIPLGLKVTMSH
ncbi:hypothetical protein BU25DRAFT_2998 [Macroventuria anomochaeta]|uniref:Uncharacterized protein n=1 Tax=Macroventuria anomochaeta TaxID=301207 RepID=A0ACB6SGI8_9PLEO|nr:uncharacterized protein BU25DRAFT_2998 [Macroventuria anomochaeta]KAF2633281.1 hypothetical protein BU25DRAFT_2998 [Macroventuria anomochaeta]